MSVWFATMLLPVLMAPPAVTQKLDAQMLLDLDLLSDDHFADHADESRGAGIERDPEMLEGLDWLDEDENGDSTDEKPQRGRR